MVLSFIGGYLALQGVLFAADTVIWKIFAGEEFIEYGIEYAVMRNQFYNIELAIGIVAIVAGLAFIIAGLRKIKRCNGCEKESKK